MSDASFAENIAPADATVARVSSTTLDYLLGYNGTNFDQLRTELGTTGFLGVGGSVAHGATDAGSPVKIGGQANFTAPTAATNGQRVNAWYGLYGQLSVGIVRNDGVVLSLGDPVDAFANANPALHAQAQEVAFNGTSWDRVRTVQGVTAGANTDLGILAAATGPGFTRKPASATIVANAGTAVFNTNGAGGAVVIVSGTWVGTLTFEATYDGTNWFAVYANRDDAAISSITTTNTRAFIAVTGFSELRARATAWTSGTATIDWVGTGQQVGVYLTGPGGSPGAGSAVVNSGSPFDANGFAGYLGVSNAAHVFNGTNWDRMREPTADAMAATGIAAAGNMLFNGSNWDRMRTEGGTTGFLGVGGSVPNNQADSGSPVKIGGRAVSGVPSVITTTGNRTDAAFTMRSALHVNLRDSSGNEIAQATSADNVALDEALNVNAINMVYDGTNTDLVRSIASLDVAPNVDTGVMAAGVGPGYDRKQNPAGVSATSTASAVTVETDGADTVTFAFTTIGVTPGSMIIESSHDDGTTWVTAGAVLKLVAETWVSGAFVPLVGDAYMVRTTGIRRIRVRVNAVYASGTVTVKWTGSTGVGLIKAMDLAPQPHNIGQTVLNYQSASLGVTTSGIAIALTSGKRIYITNIRVNTGGTVGGSVAVYSGAGAFTEGTSPTAFFGEFIPSATSKPGAIIPFAVPWASPNTGEDIRITTAGITATHIQIQYYVA
jgi:hypothetical protein